MDKSKESLLYTVHHVFMPPQLPQQDDLKPQSEHAFCQNVCHAAQEFSQYLNPDDSHLWTPISKLLEQFSKARFFLTLSEKSVINDMKNMMPGDVLTFILRSQNASIIIRKNTGSVVFEMFEVSPPRDIVMAVKGRLLCSFPGPAIQIPIHVFDQPQFQTEFARFLVSMDSDGRDSTVVVAPGTFSFAQPGYITQLLAEILCGMGGAVEVPRITKRIADDVLASSGGEPWRRSVTWLVLRVVIQTTLIRQDEGHQTYKTFMVFLHAKILQLSLQSDLPSHLIACMQKKTARRLNKLGPTAAPFILQFTSEVVAQADCLLQQRWKQAQVSQAMSLSSTWAPKTLNVVADTVLSLDNSREYLKRSLRAPRPVNFSQFGWLKNLRGFFSKGCGSRSFSNLLKSKFESPDNLIALADFELGVLTDLGDWATQNLLSSKAVESIATCMQRYSKAASVTYASNPELFSIMFLTLLRLWVELDRMTIAQYPLLADFSPEIPCALLHSLLLRSSESMMALDHVEYYLKTRHSNAIPGQSVLTNSIDKASFAIQYFDQSVNLQTLKTRIEKAEALKREKKIEELRTLKARHRDLLESAKELKCEYITQGRGRDGPNIVHAPRCHKCELESQASKMVINVYEWPLPEDLSNAKVLVFELAPPPSFTTWRRITYWLLRDICIPGSYSVLNQHPSMKLGNYWALRSFIAVNVQLTEIGLAATSSRDPFRQWRPYVSEATEESVCLNHNYLWKLFNYIKNEWVTQEVGDCTINDHCTFRLPVGPYQSLQYAVSGTSHTSNETMANQNECPLEMTVHEFIAFTRIRSAPRLQWLNVISELRTGSLSFNGDAVYALLRQTAWQIGPQAADGQREWHIEPTDKGFGEVLLAELEELLLRLRANWGNVIGMQVITTLTSRLLASATDKTIIEKGFRLMGEVRRVTYEWLNEVALGKGTTEDEGRIQECRVQICEIAATCRGTYDVGRDKVAALLCEMSDVAIFIHCGILVNHNSPPISEVDVRLRNLLHRDRRISHVMEPLLSRQLPRLHDGLDQAVLRVWEFYRPSSRWGHLPSSHGRWVATRTSPDGIHNPQAVHLDFFSGLLLINGKPLGRLPQDIVNHPTYSRIFGQRILNVIPADMPGMDFKTSSRVGTNSGDRTSGYEVFFTLRASKSKRDRSQLIIRTKQDKEILELIPHDIFNGDLPTILVKDRTHWLNVSTSKGEIEVRDLETTWISSPNNWRIHFSLDGSSTMYKKLSDIPDSLRLVDRRSITMSMVSLQLQPLEDAESLIITYSCASGQLTASLPRLRLEFYLNDEPEPRLESRNMPGMVIDTNQSSGTMIGLKSQLILCAKDSPGPSLRYVIIPYSPGCPFIASPNGHHKDVTVYVGDHHIIPYLKYTINPTLERLEGNGSMLSKLYQIYLHAITSHCLPDPLMGHTGTEGALQELRSAGALSFQKLGKDECEMLEQISNLTPTRTLHPRSHTQVVEWSKHELSPFSQHNDFRALVYSIWRYAEASGCGHPESTAGHVEFRQTSDHLLHRAAHHNAIFDRDQINSLIPPPSSQHDTVYNYPTCIAVTDRVISNISAMVFNWEPRLYAGNQLSKTLEQWKLISGIDEAISLAYTRDWLKRDNAKVFLSVCNACRTASEVQDRYRILFSFCAWAYTSVGIRPLIPIMFAFVTIPKLRTLVPPCWPSYDLSVGVEPTEEKLLEVTLECAPQFDRCVKSKFDNIKVLEEISLHNQPLSMEVKEMIDILKSQWPCAAPVIPKSRRWSFDIGQLEAKVTTSFKFWFRNKDLSEYIQNVQEILDKVPWLPLTYPATLYISSPRNPRHSVFNHLLFHQLFSERDAPDIPPPPTPLGGSFYLTKEVNTLNMDKLRGLLREFRKSSVLSHQYGGPTPIQEQYADDLEKSLQSLEAEGGVAVHYQGLSELQKLEIVRGYYDQCKVHLQVVYGIIQRSLLPSTQAETVLFDAGLWPCLMAKTLLGALSSSSNIVLKKPWRKTLNSFARTLLTFQRARRLQNYFLEDNIDEFSNELKNIVTEAESEHDETSSVELLIQIDGDFLARPIQIDFVREMIAPSSEKNTVLQLNMGEGKSSVIVPMVAAKLADRKKLVRVVVLKQLSSSMFQLLVHRLGGLANRRVFYIPFSRSPRLTLDEAQQIQNLLSMCVQVRGVLVVQPEHVLSFKLMGIDTSSGSTCSSVSNSLMKSQWWLFHNARDILDESDEILHVRYQLTYAVGQQQSLQGSPGRWTIAQQVLMLVRKHAQTVKDSLPYSIEVLDDTSGSYPRIRILRDDASTELLRLIAQDISRGALAQCSFNLFPPRLRSLALLYITILDFTSQDVHLLENYCKKNGLWNTLLILRGLLAHGILHFVLKEKRWRVDYGLDPSRSRLAVPYRAKDVPSLRAEFSHPDVAILLTCLSYYWQGLSEDQLEQCLILLLKQNNPSLQYDKWVRQGGPIPEKLKHLSGINIGDPDQRTKYHHLFRQNQAAIDFFLSQIVFPRDAKEFPKNMVTSGWDLAEHKSQVTTGFSGTKDSGYLLPTSIDQADPLLQSSTNAKVLAHLLQSENDCYRCVHQTSEQNFERLFLRMLCEQEPKIRVLLDVGAQILKLSNPEVAAEWLHANSDDQTLGIVYFGPDDEPYVLSRDCVTETLISSPFRQQLDRCLLYLDDVHTRGTDFKLPSGIRAAVTLGPKVTKDRLVQGCMRMRKLGRGHSVMFFAPPEVDHLIRIAAELHEKDQVQVKDILLWTMLESCMEVVHRIPQWAQQGIDHKKREKAWIDFNESVYPFFSSLKSAWVRNEARSLDEMYALQAGPAVTHSHLIDDYPDILERYQKWAASSFANARLGEEEEREVMAEIEVVPHTSRPPRANAVIPQVHDDVRMLVRTGTFQTNSAAFVPLFQALGRSSFERHNWTSQHLFATKDFSVTIQSSLHDNSSDYLRPVNWVLSAAQPKGTVFVVLSPDEVNDLLPDIRRSNKVHIHQYAPRVMQAMRSFEDLTFHCIPPLPASWIGPCPEIRARLNLWAGQLYLEDERAYQYLCNFLGLYTRQPVDSDIIQPDGFIKIEHRQDSQLTTCSFVESPVPYLRSVFAARRKGTEYLSTHMGKILQGKLLTGEDFHQE